MPGRIAIASLPAAAALLAGTLVVHLLPALPPARATAGVAAACALALTVVRSGVARVATLSVLGFAWCAWHAAQSLAARIPHELEGRDVVALVEAIDLPRIGADAVRFDARLLELEIDGRQVPVRGRVRLSWYGRAEAPVPGSRLELVVRLKRPRGVVNPGGFDFERFALERRHAATGYVRSLVRVESSVPNRLDAMRAAFARELRARFAGSTGALLAALAVGDQSGLAEPDWDVLRATGTAHLIAISGMHVGLVAAFGALLARAAFLAWPPLALRAPRRRIEAVAALVAACAYSLVAGMSLPVQRTLLMIAVVLLATWTRRAIATAHGLALALVAVLLADPLSALGAGFWLSFVGVAFLIFCLGGRPLAGATVARAAVAGLGRAQWAMTIGLLPLTAWFFQQASLAGPLANLVAVPWISFIVVPLLLIALGAWLALPIAFAALAQLAAWAMQAIWLGWLEPMARWRWAEWFLAEPMIGAIVLAAVGAFVLLLPRPVPGRPLGAICLLPLALPAVDRPAQGQFDLRVLDVGQGLSVLVTTARHALLYDAGPKFRSGFDMGDAAVVPALRALGLAHLDRLVVSHGDSDHAGGAESVAAALQPARRDDATVANRCRAGERWSWDGVEFEYLHPPSAFPDLENDSSCVLRIGAGRSAALLVGDISAGIEARLVRERPGMLGAVLLVSPHHGSRSSSSEGFVASVAPRAVVHSSGYRNRFGHPAPEVAARYFEAGAVALDTGRDGAVHARIDPVRGLQLLEEARETAPRYWRE